MNLKLRTRHEEERGMRGFPALLMDFVTFKKDPHTRNRVVARREGEVATTGRRHDPCTRDFKMHGQLNQKEWIT